MQMQFVFPKKPCGFNFTLVEYQVSVGHLMKYEKSGFKNLKNGSKACLLVVKNYIKSPSVPAMSARSSGCYLIAMYWQKYCGKKYSAMQTKVWEDSHVCKIPMSPLSAIHHSVSIAEYTR